MVSLEEILASWSQSSKVMMVPPKLCFLGLQVLSIILISLEVLSDVQVEVLGETEAEIL